MLWTDGSREEAAEGLPAIVGRARDWSSKRLKQRSWGSVRAESSAKLEAVEYQSVEDAIEA